MAEVTKAQGSASLNTQNVVSRRTLRYNDSMFGNDEQLGQAVAIRKRMLDMARGLEGQPWEQYKRNYQRIYSAAQRMRSRI